MWCIILIDLHILICISCLPEIKPTWSWYMSFWCVAEVCLLKFCWGFLHLCLSVILACSSLFLCIFLWFWYQGDIDLMEWVDTDGIRLWSLREGKRLIYRISLDKHFRSQRREVKAKQSTIILLSWGNRDQKWGRSRALDIMGWSAGEEAAIQRKTPEICMGSPWHWNRLQMNRVKLHGPGKELPGNCKLSTSSRSQRAPSSD